MIYDYTKARLYKLSEEYGIGLSFIRERGREEGGAKRVRDFVPLGYVSFPR